MTIHDAYMDGLYGTDNDPVEGKNTRPHGRLTVTDPDGYWILDTNSEATARQHVARFGGSIKPYDGQDKYRGMTVLATAKQGEP